SQSPPPVVKFLETSRPLLTSWDGERQVFKSTDFWFGNGLNSVWYVLFYLTLAAVYVPYAPQILKEFGKTGLGSQSLAVFAVVLMAWGGPLILFSVVHGIALIVGGGDVPVFRVLLAISFVGGTLLAVLAAAFLAGGYPTPGIPACHAIMA